MENKELYYKPFPMVILLIVSGWVLWGSFCAALFVLVSALAWLSPVIMTAGLSIIAVLVSAGLLFTLLMAVSCLIRKELISFIPTRFLWMKYFTVVARSISKRIGLDPEKVIQTYIALNNDFVLNEVRGKKNAKILILLPHCLQRHECGLKLTTDIHNCKQCGRCSISSLIDVSEELNVDIYLASGGTLARKKIKADRPDMILAIACERDLLSGIRDTMPMPVVGVFNERPEGPCINTTVSIENVRNILLKLKMA